MKKVVTYGLYNNEKSIKDFEKQIQEYIKDYGEWKIVKKFIDYTKNKQYISFEKLLNEALEENIDIILIKNVRQFCQATNYKVDFFIKFFNQKQIEVIFLDEKISTADAVGRTQIQIIVFMIQSENEMRSKAKRANLSRSYNRKKRI